MEPSASQPVASNEQSGIKKSSRKVWSVALVVGIIVLLGSIVAAIIYGYLYFGFKEPKQSVKLTYIACDSSVVQAYNQLTFPLEGDSKTSMDGILKIINEDRNSSNDPTCQSIVFFDALYNGDTETMERSLSRIKDLREKGIFIDPLLNDSVSMSTFDAVLREAQLNTSSSMGGYAE